MPGPLAFGVELHSELPLDLLPQAKGDGPCVAISLARRPRLPAQERRPHNAYWAQHRWMEIFTGHDHVVVRVSGEMEFVLAYRENRIDCTVADGIDDNTIRYWLLGQILPMFLLFNGSTELLHATAMVTEHGAVALLGQSGIGKSTLLSYGISRGAALITDEHLALKRSDYKRAVPSIPFYRPYRSVEDLGKLAPRFQAEAVTLQRIYLLYPEPPTAPVSTSRLGSADTISAILMNQQYNLYSQKFPQMHSLLADRFAGLAALTRAVSVQRLHVPRSLDRLPEVYAHIEDDLRGAA